MVIAKKETLLELCLDTEKKIFLEVLLIEAYTEEYKCNVFFCLYDGNDRWRINSKRISARPTEHGYALSLEPNQLVSFSLAGYSVCIEGVNNAVFLNVDCDAFKAGFILRGFEIARACKELPYSPMS